MPEIDEKVVSMKFDNAQFERGVSTTLSTLDKLKQSLQFKGVGDSFDGITKAANKVDLSGLQNSLQNIEKWFTPMGAAFAKIWVDAIGLVEGKLKEFNEKWIKGPFTQGFGEYELKMGSVQTIMNSTGASLEEVNRYLEELNTYADKTIYSFSDMTSNIGKFTNAGVKLEDAVAAIQGVSNVAALSGANTAEASRAMYNFAQALSSGAVKLIDWKSIENANMATVEFKNELIATAVELGTLIKNGDKYISTTVNANGKTSDLFNATTGFNDSLSSLWMTTDVLTKTLTKFSDETTDVGKRAFAAAQDVKTWTQLLDTLSEAIGSGWAQSFEIIIGDFDEAKQLFTMISQSLGNMIDRISTARNALLQMWVDNGGRKKFIDDIEKALNKVESFSDSVIKVFLGDKYDKIFGKTAENLNKIASVVPDKKVLKQWQVAIDIWTKGSYGTGEARKKAIDEIFNDEGESYKEIQKMLDGIVNGTYNYSERQEYVNEQLKLLEEQTENTSDAIEEENEKIEESSEIVKKFERSVKNVKGIAGQLVTIFKNLGNGLFTIGSEIVNSFLTAFAFDQVTADIRDFLRNFTSLSSSFKQWAKTSDTLRTIIHVIFYELNRVWNSAYSGLKYIDKTLRQIISSTDKLSKKIVRTLDNTRGSAKMLLYILENLVVTIVEIGKSLVKAFIKTFNFDKVSGDIRNFIRNFTGLSDKIREWATDNETLEKVFETVFEVLYKIWDVAYNIASTSVSTIKDVIKQMKDVIDILSDCENRLDENSKLYRALKAIKQIGENIRDLFDEIGDRIKDKFSGTSLDSVNSLKDSLDKLKKILIDISDTALEGVVSGLERLAEIKLTNLDFSPITDFFTNNYDKVVDLYNKLEEGNSIIETFKGYFHSDNADGVSNAPTVFDTIKEKMGSIFSGEENVFVKAKWWGYTLASGIVAGLKQANWPMVLEAASLLLFAYQTLQLVKLFTTVSSLLTSVTETINVVKKSLKTMFETWTKAIQTKWLETIALIIIALSVSLIALANVPQDKLLYAAVVLGAMIYVVMKLIENINALVIVMNKSKEIKTEKNDTIQQLGIFLAGLGAALYLMSKSLKMIAESDSNNIASAMAIVAGLLVAIVGVAIIMTYFVSHMNDFYDPKAFTQLGIMIELMSVALLIIAQVIKSLASGIGLYGDTNMADAMTAVLTTMSLIFLGFTLVIFASRGVHPAQVLSVALLFTIMALAINAFIPFLVACALIPSEKITNAILMIGGIIVAFTVLLGVLALIGNSPIAGLIAFSIGLMFFAAALKILADADVLDKIADGVNNFTIHWGKLAALAGGLLIFLASFGAITKKFAPGFLSFAKLMLSLGASFMFIAIGVWLFIDAFKHIGEAADGLLALADRIETDGPKLLRSIVAVVLIVVSAILFALAASKVKIAIGIVGVIITLIKTLTDYAPAILSELMTLFLKTIKFLGELFKYLADAIVRLAVILVNDIALAISDNSGPIADALGNLLLSLLSLLMGLVSKLAKPVLDILQMGLDGMTSQLREFLHGLNALFGWDWADSLANTLDGLFESSWSERFGDYVQGGMDDITEIIEASSEEQEQALADMADMWSKKSEENGTVLENVFGGFKEGLSTDLGLNPDTVIDTTAIADAANEKAEGLGLQTGMDFNSYFGQSVSDNPDIAIDGMTGMQQNITDMMGNTGDVSGYNFDNMLGESIEDNQSGVDKKTEELADEIMTQFDRVTKDRAEESGKQIVTGIRHGMRSEFEGVQSTARALGSIILREFAAKLKIESPSKEMMKLGSFAGEGLVMGLEEWNRDTELASENLGDCVVTYLSSPLQKILDFLDGNIDYDPSIRPVLDLSQLSTDISTMNGMMAERTMSLASSNASMAAKSGVSSITEAINSRNSNSDVVEAIRSLRNDINEMSAKLDSMNVVMDTGALVGQLVTPMDNAMGRRQVYKGRKN